MSINHKTAFDWVQTFGENCKDSLEIQRELQPNWNGVLGIDGKLVSIGGEKDTILIATDLPTTDLVFYDVVDGENEDDCNRFLLMIRDYLEYPVKGIVSDLGRGKVLIKLIKTVFPDVPHQACIVHFARYIEYRIPKSRKSPHYDQNRVLRNAIHDILFADRFADALELFEGLQHISDSFSVSYQRAAIKALRKHFDLLTTHFHDPELPRDNNVVENIISQMNKKLKLTKGFSQRSAAYNFLKLWAVYYRFKPFTDSNFNHRNGKSPLQLAGANTAGLEWLTFSQRSNSNS